MKLGSGTELNLNDGHLVAGLVGERAPLSVIYRELEGAANTNPQAHHVAFLEPNGERRAVLLVHWTPEERDALVGRLEAVWDGGFVNAVLDLENP